MKRLSCQIFCAYFGYCLLTLSSGYAEPLPDISETGDEIQTENQVYGITLETVNTTDILFNLTRKGGAKGLIPGAIDLLLTWKPEGVLSWKNATFFLYGLGLYGGNIKETRRQDAQGISNIAANNT